MSLTLLNIYVKGLVSMLYKHLLQEAFFSFPVLKGAGDNSFEHFKKENIQLFNENMKICSTSLVNKKYKLKPYCDITSLLQEEQNFKS